MINFPSNPTLNQLYTFNNRTWQWNGDSWDAAGNSSNVVINVDISAKANIADLTTANVIESGNLYYTNARVYANVIGPINSVNNIANTALITAQTAFGQANASINTATNALFRAIEANTTATGAFNQANAAYSKANAAVTTASLTTANVIELTNLYFTNARVVTAVSTNTLSNLTTGNIVIVGSVGDQQYNGIKVNSDRGSIEINNDFGIFVLGHGARVGVARYALNTANNKYSGMQIQRESSEKWFVGANQSENFVIRADNSLDLFTVNANGLISITGTIAGYATTSNVALKANVVDLTTANVSELTNLYFTNARVYSNVINIGYATNSNVALKANIVDLTTANVTERTNLYFTNARAIAAVSTGALSNIIITYQPSTAIGQGITVNAANTQGGTGYSDFLKVTNTSGGATNPSKTFRLSSAGAVEVINNAYTATLMSLSDTGSMSTALPYQVAGKQAVNGPAFSAYAAAILQTIPNATLTKVLFQTEEFDTNSNYASSRFTPTVEGYYQLNAEVRLDGASGTGEMMIMIYKNGAGYKRGTNQQGTQIAANFWAMQVSSIVYANGTTDYFEIYVQQGSGGSVSVTAVDSPAITWFNGCMIRGA